MGKIGLRFFICLFLFTLKEESKRFFCAGKGAAAAKLNSGNKTDALQPAHVSPSGCKGVYDCTLVHT